MLASIPLPSFLPESVFHHQFIGEWFGVGKGSGETANGKKQLTPLPQLPPRREGFKEMSGQFSVRYK